MWPKLPHMRGVCAMYACMVLLARHPSRPYRVCPRRSRRQLSHCKLASHGGIGRVDVLRLLLCQTLGADAIGTDATLISPATLLTGRYSPLPTVTLLTGPRPVTPTTYRTSLLARLGLNALPSSTAHTPVDRRSIGDGLACGSPAPKPRRRCEWCTASVGGRSSAACSSCGRPGCTPPAVAWWIWVPGYGGIVRQRKQSAGRGDGRGLLRTRRGQAPAGEKGGGGEGM